MHGRGITFIDPTDLPAVIRSYLVSHTLRDPDTAIRSYLVSHTLRDADTAIRSYLVSHPLRDADTSIRSYTADAVVVDDGHTYRGTAEVHRFLSATASEFTFTTELVDTQRIDDEYWVAVNHLEGDFPGGVVDCSSASRARWPHRGARHRTLIQLLVKSLATSVDGALSWI